MNSASTCTNTTAQTLTFKGTAASPNRVFSCSTITNNPPLTADLGTGATFTVTGANGITVNGCGYFYGITMNCGTTSSAVFFNLGNASTAAQQTWQSCQLKLVGTGGSVLAIGSSTRGAGALIKLINTPVSFGATAQSIQFLVGQLFWQNTASAIGGTVPTTLFVNSNYEASVFLDGVDLSAAGTGKTIVGAQQDLHIFQAVNCELGASVTPAATPANPICRADFIVTDSAATNYKQSRYMYQGTQTASTTVYNNATDGITPISWQVITNANCNPQLPFECFQIVQWAAAGTYANSKIFCTSATASLKTNDVWVDVEYLGSSYPLAAPATSFGAGSGSATLPQIPAGTTPGTLAAASPAWGTGGLGNDYQLAIPSFTTSAAGFVRFVVKVGKASLTVNIDDKVVIA